VAVDVLEQRAVEHRAVGVLAGSGVLERPVTDPSLVEVGDPSTEEREACGERGDRDGEDAPERPVGRREPHASLST
jgi:hypothetical protein